MSEPFPICTRRAILAGGAAALSLPAIARAAPATGLIAGTYSSGGGEGLYPLTPSANGWSAGLPITSIRNASFGVRSTRQDARYLLIERDEGGFGVFDKSFRKLGLFSSGGAGPCHVTLSPDQSALAIANYSSGSVALLQLDRASGVPRGKAQLVEHEGRGPNAERQSGPHAHWVGFSPDARWLHAVDLGADAVFAHRFDPGARTLGETTIAYKAAPGSGPRHLARHPKLPVAYLVTELANTLVRLDAQADGRFREGRVLSTLPKGFQGESFAAHIAMNRSGTRLYVSNRGHDSIAVFAIGSDGDAELIQHVPSGGHWPRFFLLLEQRNAMLVANERSGKVAILDIARDGRLRPTDRSIAVPGVVFLDTVG